MTTGTVPSRCRYLSHNAKKRATLAYLYGLGSIP